ncbi:MAG TPA: glycine betaine ABC transporter substrate-binding protein [Polyangiaceae bacterium]|nr:glycine betaine ABC transporter substrate-binding protein [Polyangiaceae bacterium]
MRFKAAAGLLVFVLAAAGLLRLAFFVIDAQSDTQSRISIGSKADTEGLLLAEIMAQLIEHDTHLKVVRRTQLGGTHICFHALLAGEIDVYPEYTGTALIAILNRPVESDPTRTYLEVRRGLADGYGLEMLRPMAFNNTYALAMSDRRASELGIRKISDLVRHRDLRAGFPAEFLGRRDGYPGLAETYDLHFSREPVSLEAGLMYDAVAQGKLDVIAAYATDGRIAKFSLRVLEDDRRFFPPYQAAPLLGKMADAAQKRAVRSALERLAGRLSDAEVRRLNALIELEHRKVSDVAREAVHALLSAETRR